MVKNRSIRLPIGIRKIGATWGVLGVIVLLGFAVYRLLPFVTELFHQRLSVLEILLLIVWCIIMIYFEGYKGFGRQFAPRVVARAQYLARQASWIRIILAPLFCIGYFGAPKKRIISSSLLLIGIVILILIVHFIPQPWRGIIDSGVVLGLLCGIFFLAFYGYKAMSRGEYVIDPEVT